jgi:prefoldin subunit 5
MTELQEIFGRLSAVEGDIKSMNATLANIGQRMDGSEKMIESIYDLTAAVKINSIEFKHFAEKTDVRMTYLEERHAQYDERQMKMGERIGNLEQAPGKRLTERWEKIFMQAVTSLVSAGVGAILAVLAVR